MFIQLDNLIKSWEIRNEAIEDISTKLSKTKINDNFVLIANVPFALFYDPSHWDLHKD